MITYAGVELCYEDERGEITAWIERFLPLEDLRDQTQPAALRSQRPASRSDYQPGVNLPLPNYPEPPRPKLSTLYWPSGAARWSRGYFLCTGSQLDEIMTATANGDNAASLVLKDQESNVAITAKMYLLAPRQLTAATGGDEVLYLLTLVDQRYFWQFANSGAIKVTRSSTWSGVFALLQAALGISTAIDPIASAYGIPDPDELSRPFENAAILLDAAAHSVGLAVVADLDGTISLMSAATSNNLYLQNLAAKPSLLAGGDFSTASEGSAYPEKVTITFQKYRQGAVYPNGDLYNVDVAAATVGFGGTPGRVKLIHSTALADFTGLGASPDNSLEVQSLATQIAEDYYASLSYRYDYSLASIVAWTPTSFDDHVEWTLGRLCGSGHYQAQTRIQSLPYNFGVEEQLQQFADKPIYPSPTRFKLTANLVPQTSPTQAGNSAAAVHQSYDSTANEWIDTTDSLTAWDANNAFPGLAGEYGYAWFKGDSLRWEILSIDNRFLHGKLNAAMAPGGSAAVTVWINTAGVDSATTMVVTAWDWLGVGFPSGAKVFLRWDVTSNRWYALSSGQPVLAKSFEDIANRASGKIRFASGTQGSETTDGIDRQAYNYFFGIIPTNHWVWVQPTGDGLYITQCETRTVYGQVTPGQTSQNQPTLINAVFPGGTVQVTLFENDNATNTVITAEVELAPIFSGEFVTCIWNGKNWIVASGDYDGGINGLYTGASTLPKGTGSPDFLLQIYPQTSPNSKPNFNIVCKLGDLATGPSPGKAVRISRDANGVFVTAEEC